MAVDDLHLLEPRGHYAVRSHQPKKLHAARKLTGSNQLTGQKAQRPEEEVWLFPGQR